MTGAKIKSSIFSSQSVKPTQLFAVLNQAGRVIESPRIAFYHILALIARDRLPEARDAIRNAVRLHFRREMQAGNAGVAGASGNAGYASHGEWH